MIHEKEAHVCEICGKDIPESELTVKDVCVRHGHRGRAPQYRQGFYHTSCYLEKQKHDAEARAAQRKYSCAKAKKISFGWSTAIGVVATVIAILSLIKGGGMKVFPGIAVGILIGYAMFSSAYCIFTGSYLGEVFLWCASRSIRFPGLIFSWDIDGFVWVICMKILFVILGFMFGLLMLGFGIALCGVLGAFSFPFVLIYNNKHDYEDSLFGF